MQGIFIYGSRPESKSQIKAFVDGMYTNPNPDSPDGPFNDPFGLVIEATSIFGNEFDGSLAKATRQLADYGYLIASTSEDQFGNEVVKRAILPIDFVGPDPHTNRRFYGQLVWNNETRQWKVR